MFFDEIQEKASDVGFDIFAVGRVTVPSHVSVSFLGSGRCVVLS